MSVTRRRLLVLVTVATLALTEALHHGAPRVVSGLILILGLPGLAWYSALGRDALGDRVTGIVVILSVSLAVTILAGLGLAALGLATGSALVGVVGAWSVVFAVCGAFR